MQIEFQVPAVPVAMPRQRHRLVKTNAGKEFIQNYAPTKHPVQDFKATVRYTFRQVYKGPPLSGALRVDVVLVFPRPKGLIWKKRAMPRLYHTVRPDRDNVDKSILDSLKGLAWVDDAQICAGYIEKWYASGSEAAHVQIRIRELDGFSLFNGEPKYTTAGS